MKSLLQCKLNFGPVKLHLCSRIGYRLVGVRGKRLVSKTELVFPRRERLAWWASSRRSTEAVRWGSVFIIENGFTTVFCLLIAPHNLVPKWYVMDIKGTESCWSCVLESALDVDGQVAVILAPSIIHSVVWVSHQVSLSPWQVRMRLALPPCSFRD